MSGLRAAAAALIAEAPEATVQIILRMLVDSLVPAATQAKGKPVQLRPRHKPKADAKRTTAALSDPEWEDLRGRVKAAMAERGANYAGVAAAISRSEIATRISIGSRKPPPPIVRTRLQEWLDQAPAVATPLPFPGSGTERRGNGHVAGGAYSSTAGHGSAAGNGSSLDATD